MSTVMGALMPAGTNERITEVQVGDYKSIQDLIGGLFDCVRAETPTGEVLVGYVHDEGLMLGMETNWYASALFGRELVGPCVVVSGTSPDGAYDGDNYDLPQEIFQFLVGEFTQHVADTYNESALITMGVNLAVKFGIIGDEELSEFRGMLESFAPQDEVYGWLDRIADKVSDYITEREMSNIDEEIEQFLKAQGK